MFTNLQFFPKYSPRQRIRSQYSVTILHYMYSDMPSFTYLFRTQVPNSTSELGQSALSHCNVTTASVQKGGAHLSLVVIGTHCKKNQFKYWSTVQTCKKMTRLYCTWILFKKKKTKKLYQAMVCQKFTYLLLIIVPNINLTSI